MAFGPVVQALSEWILDPGSRQDRDRQGVEEDVGEGESRNATTEMGARRDGDSREREVRGRVGRQRGQASNAVSGSSRTNAARGNAGEPRGLAGLLLGAAYSAGLSLLTGDFSALSAGSDEVLPLLELLVFLDSPLTHP